MAVPKNVMLAASGVDVINAVREIMSFKDRIPPATADNIRETGAAILQYEPVANEFVSALVNRIARVEIKSRLYYNPLVAFKRGIMNYGDTIEEAFVNIAQAHEYNPATAEDNLYKRVIPDISAVFHRLNSQLVYPVTIQDDSLRTAFLTPDGILNVIARIVDSLYSGANNDEFLSMKELLSINKPYYFPVKIDAVSADNSKSFVTSIKSMSNMIEFMSGKYNRFGVQNFTPKNRQIILLRADIDAIIDVNVLASAFNMDKAEFMGRRVLVDDFGSGMEDVYAILCDDEFFMVYNMFEKFTENYNGLGLYWNYFWHVWRIYSTSPFSNAIMFTSAVIPEATAITLTPATPTVPRGGTVQFSSTTTPAEANQSVRYTISGQEKGGTFITSNGLLSVAKNETSTSIVVTATSALYPSITANTTVTVS